MSILNPNETPSRMSKSKPSRREDPAEKHQRLSHSINDLFSSLLHQLEANKNKTYVNNNKLVTEESILNDLNEKTLLSYDQPPTSATGKKQALSKDSNKDSGFNQEFINDTVYRNKYYASRQKHPDQHEYENGEDISLLERYLNNEQLVAYKHSQLEAYLSRVYAVSFCNDFAMLDYMLNQEGLSRTTFKKLIREKFANFEWTNTVLLRLHEIVNQRPEVAADENLDGGFSDDFETTLIDRKEESTSPSSSSSVSFKKLRDIKALSSQAKKRSGEKTRSTAEPDSCDSNVPKSFLVDLKNTFVQRRQRKGSLPEIQFNNGQLNDTTLVLSNGAHDGSNTNDSTLSVRSRAHSSIAACKRFSRRSAFVLDPMRTSMFRSKSLTDLNNTLVRTGAKVADASLDRSETNLNNLTLNNHSIIENLNCSTLNLSRAGGAGCESPLVRQNHSLENSFSGVVWQCADMIYEEFRNKYEELRWLMVSL